ncbi:MAG: hypothetical protein GW893_14860 [Armatimonadetes bacterium]|nr:hypothetical protein [Armatimonadota bacterium]PJB73703.1 MAG: hypothetical protein CO095_05540 [Armatimonadetes bacterium CG_4_9_14_3_um_filter_58_7]
MEPTTGVQAFAGVATSFLFFSLSVGLALLGVVVYFLVTLHRIAGSLEEVVEILRSRAGKGVSASATATPFEAVPTPSGAVNQQWSSEGIPNISAPTGNETRQPPEGSQDE